MVKAQIQINYRDKTLEMDTYKEVFDSELELEATIHRLGTTDRLTEVGGLGVFIPASQIVSVHYMILED